jgi:hypothetical protein
MLSALAGMAAVFGALAVYAEVRRRVSTSARISRRLHHHAHPSMNVDVKHFCFHAPTLMPWMVEDADPA